MVKGLHQVTLLLFGDLGILQTQPNVFYATFDNLISYLLDSMKAT